MYLLFSYLNKYNPDKFTGNFFFTFFKLMRSATINATGYFLPPPVFASFILILRPR